MRKSLILLALMSSFFINAQKISVTPNGIKDSENIENNFVVLKIEGRTASQLYENAMKYIHMNYKNPNEVIKGNIENEYIKFETFIPDFPTIKNGGIKINMNTLYTTALNFKDGKIKYEIINIEMTSSNKIPVSFSGSVWSTSSFPIYNKEGELKRKEAKEDLESYFNKTIQALLEMETGNKANDKW